jgi:hypothetical protein
MKVLIFGATGAAGGSILQACLKSSTVTEVHAITRRALRFTHPKLRPHIHKDFLDYSTAGDAFDGIDACLFCLGISVTQVSGEEEYRTITHDFALAAARMMLERSPGAAFHFISGQGTNPNGRLMWQKVKGATEQELMELVGAVCWRPAAIGGSRSESAPWYYSLVRPLLVLLKPIRGLYIDGEDFGRAMIQATVEKMRRRVIENSEIRDIADRARD